MVDLLCPSCGTKTSINEAYAGPAVGCSTCGGSISNLGASRAPESTFRAAAYWMGIMGRLSLVFGALATIAVLGTLLMSRKPAWSVAAGSIPGIIMGPVSMIVGAWTLRAGSAFGRVAERTGLEIENVIVEAVTNLKKLYQLQAVVLILLGLGLFGFLVLG